MKRGDIVTLPGIYQPRTLREWLLRAPRQPQLFEVIGGPQSRNGAVVELAPLPAAKEAKISDR